MQTPLISWILILAFGVFALWDYRRKKRRRDSLRKEPDGTWTWIGLDGSEYKSPNHPDRPGGDWYAETSNTDGWGD
ncbi:hypothetical protein PhaeoP72_00402 [Phaeobacter inhibens]|nr:hypothetical protein PhaeoP72_00402 [Phaeobacter inhibens]